MRVDCLLVSQGFCESRAKAQQCILAGQAYANGKLVSKPSQEFAEDTNFEVKEAESYVSRSGFKLSGLLAAVELDLKDKTALDVGISTGGFTDCLLQQGIKNVTGVDVGHEQLHHKLKRDPRVVLIEGSNARDLASISLPHSVYDVIVVDVSFISLTKILAPIWARLAPEGYLLALIKPQFELTASQISKGVVSPKYHKEACQGVHDFCQTLPNAYILGIHETCLKGQKGNQEFFIVAKRQFSSETKNNCI